MLGIVVSYRMLTNISTEHFLNTPTRDFFHLFPWSPRLNLDNPKWKMIFQGKSSCIILISRQCAIAYIISSYLVQSTCEVRKLKYFVWARLVERTDGQCLCISLSVINDYALTGSTPHWVCEAGEYSSPWCRIYALMNWIRGTELALVKVVAGCLFGAKPLPKVILTNS